jgi:hypothetical protein
MARDRIGGGDSRSHPGTQRTQCPRTREHGLNKGMNMIHTYVFEANGSITCYCDQCCANGHCACETCNEPCECAFCPECGDELDEHDSNQQPTWSDAFDDIVCNWCATAAAREAYLEGGE